MWIETLILFLTLYCELNSVLDQNCRTLNLFHNFFYQEFSSGSFCSFALLQSILCMKQIKQELNFHCIKNWNNELRYWEWSTWLLLEHWKNFISYHLCYISVCISSLTHSLTWVMLDCACAGLIILINTSECLFRFSHWGSL